MRFLTTVPYRFAPINVTINPAQPEFVYIVKGTFGFDHRRIAWPLDAADQTDFAGDTPFMDDIGRSLRTATDLVSLKPYGEVTLTADCCVPGGRESVEQECFLEAGPIRKRLLVSGDRIWLHNGRGRFLIGDPLPFSRMPLRWERAFGGLSHPQNRFGRGMSMVEDADGQRRRYLPNIEDPRHRVTRFDDAPEPAGFAPISPSAQSRLAAQGTRDQHWATFRAPLPPDDYEPRAEQAAPPDQWLDGYWTGDEPIRLGGMDPVHAVIETRLPGRRPRLFVDARTAKSAPRRFVEIPLLLDTVHIDVTEKRIVLIWRRAVQHRTRDTASEIDAIYLTEEPTDAEPRPASEHHEDYLALRGPEPEPREAKLDRAEAAAVAEARKTLESANVDPSFMKAFDSAKTSQAKLDMVLDLVRTKTAELERVSSTLRPPNR
jgi:hypothetical protein